MNNLGIRQIYVGITTYLIDTFVFEQQKVINY